MSKLRQALRLMRDPFSMLAQAHAECGDLFAIHVPGLGRVVFVCSAKLLDEVYRRGEDEISAGEIRKKMLGYLVGSKSSISIDGEKYTRRRRLLAPYLGGKWLPRYAETIHGFTEQVVASWPREKPFSLQPGFEEITCKTICRILYGPLDRPANQHLAQHSVRFLEAFRSPAVHVPPLQWNLGRFNAWGRFLSAKRELRQALEREILARVSTAERGADNLVTELVAARLEPDEDLARETIVQEVLNLLVGGGATTATALTWTFLGLLRNRDALERLRQEVDDVLGERPFALSDFQRMPYLDAVLHEGMRFQPVAPHAGPRVVEKDVELGGYHLPAGTLLMQCFSEVGRNPDVFANPDRFDPQNFFGRNVKAKDWMPFGGGSRMCTGMGLARLEIAIAVTTIVRSTELELAPGSKRPVRCGVVFQPKDGLRVRLVTS